MRARKETFSHIYQETEEYLKNLDVKRCTPPYIAEVFISIRSKAFQMLTRKKNVNLTIEDENQKLVTFIEKFEIEYMDILLQKLKEKYAHHIKHKNYNVSSDVNFKHLKNVGAIQEMNQLSTLIAEWSLELESLQYSLEGLKLYGLQDSNITSQKNFDSILTANNSSTNKPSNNFSFLNEYLFRKLMGFALARFSNMAIFRGFSKAEFGSKALIQIVMMFSISKKVPWTLILKHLNLPWIVGGFACSLIINQMRDYIVRNQTVANLQIIYQRIEKNKIYIMSERRSIVNLALKLVSNTSQDREQNLKKLNRIINHLLNPTEEKKENEISPEEIEMMFEVKELEDYILVEERDHQEKKDKSGVVVVDW